MSVLVRKPTSDEAPIVALLGRITFSETFGHLFERYPHDLADYLQATFDVTKIRRSIADPNNSYWLALIDDLPVGYAKVKADSATPHISAPKVAQLQKIYVLREFRDRKVGPHLLAACRERAATLEAGSLWLAVLGQNDRAIHFYRKHGFETVGTDRFTIGEQTFDFAIMAVREGARGAHRAP
jgi:ribosomal protein S18 acetylase RimI-like enzyme